MLKLKYLNALLVIAFIIFLSSCIEKELDFDGIKSQKWTSDWALPLISSSLGIADLINDSAGIIQEDEDGLIILVYESEEFFEWDTEDLTSIPDQESTLTENFYLPQVPPDFTGNIPIIFSLPFNLNQEGQRVDSALIKAGSYHFRIRTDLNKNQAGVHFTVPNLVNATNGEPLQFYLDISYNPQQSQILKDTTINLEGYTLYVDQTTSGTNELSIEALVDFTGDNNPDNSPYFMQLENEFAATEFSRFFGYAGYQSITMNDTLQVDIFRLNEEGYFDFGPGSVNLKIDLWNSFGIPADLEFLQFKAVHDGPDPESLDIYLFGEGNPAIINLNYPDFFQVGQSILTEVETVNSNIHEALDISPDKLFLDLEARINPGQDPNQENFALDTSHLKAKIALELQLFGSVSGFKIADTVDFNIDDVNEIDYIEFAVDVSNGFPINAEMQLFFVDSVYNELFVLLTPDEALMPAASVGNAPEYRVQSPAEKITYIDLGNEEIEKLPEARQIIIRATLSTYEGDLVKIYSDYAIDLKLGAKFGLN
ncbi:MAG: hypothetical protein JW731_04045, partial [Bacteroidales bacterium]|nr:hypothetical protein [Bacteroidales bacterium]